MKLSVGHAQKLSAGQSANKLYLRMYTKKLKNRFHLKIINSCVIVIQRDIIIIYYIATVLKSVGFTLN